MYWTIFYDQKKIYQLFCDQTKNQADATIARLSQQMHFQNHHQFRIKTLVGADSLLAFMEQNRIKIDFWRCDNQQQLFLLLGWTKLEQPVLFSNVYDPTGDLFELQTLADWHLLLHWLKERWWATIKVYVQGKWNCFLQNHFDQACRLFLQKFAFETKEKTTSH